MSKDDQRLIKDDQYGKLILRTALAITCALKPDYQDRQMFQFINDKLYLIINNVSDKNSEDLNVQINELKKTLEKYK